MPKRIFVMIQCKKWRCYVFLQEGTGFVIPGEPIVNGYKRGSVCV